jgi:tripartite-type tricarboxylate transporter receptor subunit TctC
VKLAIYELVSKIMKTDAMQKKIFDLGYTAANDGPEAFQKIVNNDIDRFTKLAKDLGLSMD